MKINYESEANFRLITPFEFLTIKEGKQIVKIAMESNTTNAIFILTSTSSIAIVIIKIEYIITTSVAFL